MHDLDTLSQVLKDTFGFGAFRPRQREIMDDVLAGRDVFALLPTGGGKSLCYQLPALVRPGLTLVVSPLVALMKDQVDGLRASGVAATFLNSTLSQSESRERWQGLEAGEFKLLYAAPERIFNDGFLAGLKRWNVGLVAVDEAHCISEWGHDFRPEYRQLAQLRELLPGTSMMALTATATERVREDIVKHLKLRAPAVHVASFNRPNLTYRVKPKRGAAEQLLAFVRERAGESGIVYCQSRRATEEVAAMLARNGVTARAYHAGMESADRSAAQDAFIRDDARVVCATIAFGMGIDKPNVRFVVHYDLPKNIEGYYQETGRAGRDGLPSECLLLFSAGDVVKYQRFIDEKEDEHERETARRQLRGMVAYAEGTECRRRMLLNYFGEEWAEPNCGACDNCMEPRETFDGTLEARQFLSCIYRIKQHGNFGVGMAHVVAVLTGGMDEKIRKWGHDKLSTYGIGKARPRAAWREIGRELLRLNLVEQTPPHNVLEITRAGMEFLKEKRTLRLTRPMAGEVAAAAPKRVRAGAVECDEVLFERLRALRRKIAGERSVPAYVIFSDVSLRWMARSYPVNLAEFGRITGVGSVKCGEYGPAFTADIAAHVGEFGKKEFADDLSPPPTSGPEIDKPTRNLSTDATIGFYQQGLDVPAIAAARGMAESTIWSHLFRAGQIGEQLDPRRFYTSEQAEIMREAFARADTSMLGPVKELVGDAISYDQLRMFRLLDGQGARE